MREQSYFIDLKVFGAIGFQDAPNGLWLGVQGYRPQSTLLQRVIDSAIKNETGIVGITSEDDRIIPNYPEDRFGFLASQADSLPQGYNAQKLGALLFASKGEREVVLVNCETVHAPEGSDWHGLKLHVVGKNMLPKKTSLKDTAAYCNDNGLPYFLHGVCSDESKDLADSVAEGCTGVIIHDATNSLAPRLAEIPVIGGRLANYTRRTNETATAYAESRDKPGIAVSNSKWMKGIGRGGFATRNATISLSGGQAFLESLEATLDGGTHVNHKAYIGQLTVLNFGRLLGKHGGAPNRFKGTKSSYNEPA